MTPPKSAHPELGALRPVRFGVSDSGSAAIYTYNPYPPQITLGVYVNR